jgi:hypothetical protein
MCACSGPVTKHIEDLEAHIRAMYDDLVAEFARKKEQGLVRFYIPLSVCHLGMICHTEYFRVR